MTTTTNLALYVCLIVHNGEVLPVQKERNIFFLLSNISSDDVWNEVKHILPTEKPRNTKGHPTVPFRKILDGILFVLRTECQWNKMLPKEYGSGSTCHRRFQDWLRIGIFKKLWVMLLKICDDIQGIKWKWLSLDSVTIKAPLGGGTREGPIRQIEES